MTDAEKTKTDNPNEVPPGSLPIENKKPGNDKVPSTPYPDPKSKSRV
jgi:hypothetical protein